MILEKEIPESAGGPPRSYLQRLLPRMRPYRMGLTPVGAEHVDVRWVFTFHIPGGCRELFVITASV